MRLEEGPSSREGYARGWRDLHGTGPSEVLIEFRISRSRDGSTDFLGDWTGTLITDGYSGFDQVVLQNSIVHAGCWAHA